MPPLQAANLEEFISASSSVKPGLIASGIVSAWTWAATLLQSSAVAYKFGIAGPWWYAAGATYVSIPTVQSLEPDFTYYPPSQRPDPHLLPERRQAQDQRTARPYFPRSHPCSLGTRCTLYVHVLWTRDEHYRHFDVGNGWIGHGHCAHGDAHPGRLHAQYVCFHRQPEERKTHVVPSTVPVGVVIYVWIGGLRASLLADYIHTSALFAIIIAFMFVTFATSDKIGSPSKMYDMLEAIGKTNPVEGNANGSYLTFRSQGEYDGSRERVLN